MELKDLLKMDLQMFAEPEGEDGNDPGEPEKPTDKNEPADKPKDKPEAKYTDEDVDKIINEKFAKWQEKQAEKIAEAEKLAKMNADDREKYRMEQLEKELAEYKQKDTFYSLSKEAGKMLSEHGIQTNDELLQFVVKDDAEGTQSAVNAFVDVFNKAVESQVKEKLSGKAPRVNTNKNNETSRKFSEMTYTERLELKAKSPEEYKRLLKENE